MKKRVPVTISLPPDIALDYSRIAKKEAKNKSELFREMFKVYKRETLKEKFYELQDYGSKLAEKRGIYNEKQVESIVFQGRRKQSK